jgi:putative membrane protein
VPSRGSRRIRIARRVSRSLGTRLLLAWLGNCAGLLLAAAIVPAIGYGEDAGTLLLAGAILGIVNVSLRPLVILLTLPAVLLSLGLALLAINALMLWLTSRIVTDLTVGGFASTVAGALIVWVVNLLLRNGTRPPRPPWSPPLEVRLHWRR